MSTWLELYEDYRVRLSAYSEDIDVTPQLFMRYVALGIRDLQKNIGRIRNTKQIPITASGPLGTICDIAAAPAGADVETILLMWEENSGKTSEIFRAPFPMWQETVEKADIRRNDFPHGLANARRGTTPPAGTQINEYMENRMYWQLNNTQITIYPELAPGTQVSIYYIVHYGNFSPSSPFWASWFPIDTNFMGQFTTNVPIILEPYEEAFTMYSSWKTLQHRGLEFWKEEKALYQEVLQQLLQIRASQASLIVSPYGIL